jgi:diguanylate cyclase (GGDEF)-like protein
LEKHVNPPGTTDSGYADNFAYEPTSVRERQIAIGFASVLALLTVIVAPIARHKLAPVPSFLLLVESIAIISLILTGTTLFAQYRARRYAPIAILGVGFIAYGLMHLTYITTFPGLFAKTGLFGAGPQSAVFVYTAGRLLFAFAIFAFVFAERREQRGRGWRRAAVETFLYGTLAAVAALALYATLGHHWLPSFLDGHGSYTKFYVERVQPFMFLVIGAALVSVVMITGFRTRVSVWLTITLVVQLLDMIVSGTFSGARYSIGWYVARFDIAVSAMVYIVAIQVQLAGILHRAARSNTRAHALFRISSSEAGPARDTNTRLVETALLELGFEWGFITRIEDGHVTIETSVGSAPPERDSRTRIETYLLHGVTSRELFVMEGAATQAGAGLVQWSAFASVPVFVDGKMYGAVGFASRKRRKTPINDADRDFLYLLGILAGSAIENDRRSQRLTGLAFYDSLTGLANRAQFLQKLSERLSQGERYGVPFAVHFLDLDLFKPINDRYGHAVGDEVLREVAKRLRDMLRAGDTVARLGGDEFVILQKLEAGEREAETLRDRIVAAFEAPIGTTAGPITIGISIGIGLYPKDGADAQSLLAAADQAQYRVKNRRRWVNEPAPKREDKRVLPLERKSASMK